MTSFIGITDSPPHVFALLGRQLDRNLLNVRTHLTSESPARTSSYCTRVPFKVLSTTYNAHRSRSNVRGYRASISKISTTQQEATRRMNVFSGQPCARRPSCCIPPRTTRSPYCGLRPRRSVRSSDSRLAATRQFLPKVSRTAPVKIGTRPHHECVDIETLLEDVTNPFPSTLAFMRPAETCEKEQRSLLIYCVQFRLPACDTFGSASSLLPLWFSTTLVLLHTPCSFHSSTAPLNQHIPLERWTGGAHRTQTFTTTRPKATPLPPPGNCRDSH
jgi:hypothetical protein